MNIKLALVFAVAILMVDYSITASIDNKIISSTVDKKSESEITPPETSGVNIPTHLRDIFKSAEKSLQNITQIVNTTSLLLDEHNENVKDTNSTFNSDDPPKVPLLTDLLEFLDKENRQVYSIIQNLIKQIRSRLPPFLRPNEE